MGALFSFGHRVHLEKYAEYSYKAITVKGAIWPTALAGCQGLAGSALQDGGVTHEH